MNGKAISLSILALFTIFAAQSAMAQFRLGEGVANDHASGGNARDVVFIARGGENVYGYRSYTTAIGLTLLPWAIPNEESSVKGLRLNWGWGHYAETYGVDVGLFSNSGSFGGIAGNFLGNAVANDAAGLQVGLVNVAGRTVSGVQIGMVNYAERLQGVQLGLLNMARTQWTLPILNIAW